MKIDSPPAAIRPGRIWRNASASAGGLVEVYMCVSRPPESDGAHVREAICEEASANALVRNTSRTARDAFLSRHTGRDDPQMGGHEGPPKSLSYARITAHMSFFAANSVLRAYQCHEW